MASVAIPTQRASPSIGYSWFYSAGRNSSEYLILNGFKPSFVFTRFHVFVGIACGDIAKFCPELSFCEAHHDKVSRSHPLVSRACVPYVQGRRLLSNIVGLFSGCNIVAFFRVPFLKLVQAHVSAFAAMEFAFLYCVPYFVPTFRFGLCCLI